VRAILLVIVALAAPVVAGCGGSGDQTASLNGETLTVPSDVHDVYGEVEAFLGQLPYQSWYVRCVVKRVEAEITPAEAKALSELPEAEREGKATQVIAKAVPACEKSTDRPVIDPNSSSKELDLLRAGDLTSMNQLAEAHHFSAAQTACIERGFEELPDSKIIAIGNGTEKARDGILLSVFKPCAKVK
jgi:hypothetical protein